MRPDQIDPAARTMVSSHTNRQVVCATARSALIDWTRALTKAGHKRLRKFLEAVHAHDLAARCPDPMAQVWRRRLAAAIALEEARSPESKRAARAARRAALRMRNT